MPHIKSLTPYHTALAICYEVSSVCPQLQCPHNQQAVNQNKPTQTSHSDSLSSSVQQLVTQSLPYTSY